MTEFKTLKDIYPYKEDEFGKYYKDKDLRKEAIKWIKHILPKIEGCRFIEIEETPSLGAKITWEYAGEKGEMDDYWCGMITAYVDFFNITKEDLK